MSYTVKELLSEARISYPEIELRHKKTGAYLGSTIFSPNKEHAIAAYERTYKRHAGNVIAQFPRKLKEGMNWTVKKLLESTLEDTLKRKHATKEDLDKLLDSGNRYEKEAVIRHDKATKEHFDKALKDEDWYVRSAAKQMLAHKQRISNNK